MTDNMGMKVDKYYITRQQRLEAQRVVDELAKQESLLKEEIIREMPRDTTGITGHIGKVTRKEMIVPTVKDWDALHTFIEQHKAWELVQRRVNTGAVKERWEAGEVVPGVESHTIVDLSVGKA